MSGDPTNIPTIGPEEEKAAHKGAAATPVGADDRREWFHSMRSWWDTHPVDPPPAASTPAKPTAAPTSPIKPPPTS
jgi:hypothetical protein